MFMFLKRIHPFIVPIIRVPYTIESQSYEIGYNAGIEKATEELTSLLQEFEGKVNHKERENVTG
jgi:hypothetical protein